MLYFYTQLMPSGTVFLTFLFQVAPVIIGYLVTIRYCLPHKTSVSLLLISSVPTFILSGLFTLFLRLYFQEIMVIHNIFVIVCQFFILLSLYLIYHRGKTNVFLKFLIITFLIIIWASIFEYIRIFLLYYFPSVFISVFTVNWFFLSLIAFLSLVKLLLAWIAHLTVKHLTLTIRFFWCLLVAFSLFQLFVQINAVTGSYKHDFPLVIFLSSENLAYSFLKQLVPSSVFIVENIDRVFPLTTLFTVTAMLFICTFFFLLFINRYRKQIIVQQNQHSFELSQYLSTLETMSKDIRKNHHDFSNILFSLGGHIFQTPIDDLKLKKYYQSVTQTFEKDYNHFLEISKLKNIEIPGLKTLLFAKIMVANKSGVPLHLEIEKPLSDLPLDELALSRICGILLDNALEASVESSSPFVHLAFIEDNLHILFIVRNAVKEEYAITNLNQESFSTKGKNRGLGLSIVREILAQNRQKVTLKTIQGENEIQQILIFEKEFSYGN
ncbi:sensor histidine kinase [Enterococcus sp. LJL120]